MSLTFGKTIALNFGRIFQQNPRLLTRNTYLNFLRYFKLKHPQYGFQNWLQLGQKAWCKMTSSQQDIFSQKNILNDIAQPPVPRSPPPKSLHPHVKRRAKAPVKRSSKSYRIPWSNRPMKYHRRSLNTQRNIRNKRRTSRRLYA